MAPTAIHHPLIRATPLQASIEVVEVSRYLGGSRGNWAKFGRGLGKPVQVACPGQEQNLTVKVMILARDDEGDGIIWDWACSTTFLFWEKIERTARTSELRFCFTRWSSGVAFSTISASLL